MPQNKQALKRRIRSVKATKKITSAMELIATSKLQKQKHLMEANRLYATTLHETLTKVLAKAPKDEVRYLNAQSGPTLTLVFLSDMGLCGAYNSNLINFLKANALPDERFLVVGSKGNGYFRRSEADVLMQFEESDRISYAQLSKLGDKAVDLFDQRRIGRFRVIYTRFVNSMSFEPTILQLLPLSASTPQVEEPSQQDLILEPNAVELVGQIIPMYLHSLTYSLWLESKTSEQAARRLAMDNATDNAQEIIDELILKFNQTRQAAITQEITEIVAGAEAL